MVGGALTVDDIDAIVGMSSGGVDHDCRDGRSTSSRILLGEASEPGSKLREGIDRAAARDRRVATGRILRARRVPDRLVIAAAALAACVHHAAPSPRSTPHSSSAQAQGDRATGRHGRARARKAPARLDRDRQAEWVIAADDSRPVVSAAIAIELVAGP